jgi:hypothetical protein
MCSTVNQCTTSIRSDIFEPDSTPSLASEIICNGDPKSRFLPSKDLDYFKFTAKKDSCYQIILTNAPDCRLSLYSNDSLLGVATSTNDSIDAFWKCNKSGTVHLSISQNSTSSRQTYYYTVSLKSFGDTFESDNDSLSASELITGETQTHTVYNGDADWLKFFCKRPVIYAIVFTGRPSPVSVYFHNKTYPVVLTSDTLFLCQDYTNQNLFVRVGNDSLQSNSLSLNQNHWRYTVKLIEIQNDSYEPNDSIAIAKPVAINGMAVFGSLNAGDIDCYLLPIEEGKAYHIKGNGSHNYQMLLGKPDRSLVKNVSLDSIISFQAIIGGNYLFTISAGISYDLRCSTQRQSIVDNYSFTINTIPNDTFEPDDSFKNAKVIATDGTVQQRILIDGEYDFIKFRMQKDSSYLFRAKNLGDSRLYAMRDTSKYVALINWRDYKYDSLCYWTCAQTDTYYICNVAPWRVSPDPQNYSFSIKTFSNDAFEYDNYPVFAKKINVNDSTPALRTIPNDVDWIKFSALSGVRYEIKVTNTGIFGRGAELNNLAELFSGDGSTFLIETDPLEHKIIWTAPSSEDYLVKVRLDSLDSNYTRYSTYIDYKLHIKSLTQPNLDPDIIRTTAEHAIVNQTCSFDLKAGDQKWIAFNATTDSSYQFVTTAYKKIEPILYPPELNNALVTYTPYSSYGSSGYYQSAFVFDFSKNGTYYLKFSPTDTATVHVYLLISTFERDIYEPELKPTVMPVNSTPQKHSLGIGDTEDSFVFESIAGYKYRIQANGKDLTLLIFVGDNSTAKYTVISKGADTYGTYIYFTCTQSGTIPFYVYTKNYSNERVYYTVSLTSDLGSTGIRE